ncbi:protein of unknown function DUF1028 [Natranaerobius thermophilus JW/NM-WN-LF]|uniref:Uncharacterized protein n=2 Tax=Natranaerobius TaxID=375928 RepID=B2A0J4_NATTJ|nr:protein of unknown function DUF1028 [Natranaerobius thermophilus JW/NM-WN-LF]
MNQMGTGTYSIAAYDPQFQEWGVGVQSRFLSVGALVPWVSSNTGAIATQAKTNSMYGTRAFELINNGKDAKQVVETLISEDPQSDYRQVGVVDAQGNVSAHTGNKCIGFAGHKLDTNFVCQGNLLVGEGVLDEMVRGFKTAEGDLADKLVASLQGAQNAGGERRGVQSAALLIKKNAKNMFGQCNSYIDLRVDDSQSPLLELNRLKNLHRILFAQNHSDKYFEFDTEIKKKLVIILQEIKEIDQTLAPHENMESVIENFSVKKGYKKDEVFKGNFINGKIINEIVNTYYSYEPEHYT